MSVDNCMPACMQKNEGLPRPIDPIAIIRGTTNQSMLPGIYAGNQCTSICVAALAWFYGKGNRGHFTTEAIDTVLYTGNELHTYLREVEKASTARDGRVALDDLPQIMNIGDVQLIRNKEEEKFALLFRPNDGFADFLMLRDLLHQYAVAPFGILLTVDQYSQAVFYTCNGRWAVFDSHGYLRYKCRLTRPFASVWEFDSVEAVVGFLVEVRPDECHCQVHKPSVISLFPPPEIGLPSPTNWSSDEESDPEVSTENSESSLDVCSDGAGNGAVVSPTQIHVKPVTEDDDDENPYVCLMGGF